MTTQTETREKSESVANAARIDFKMVTFVLAGKEYGVDIMNVKEIAKASRFTYVPNAAPFVRGVYNLRGDIISIIDMRIFFHLPAERKADDAAENLLILKVGEMVFGIIVDMIDKVVGVASSSVQPPHPIFGDINVKYMRGVVENAGKLYIILDADRVFAPSKRSETIEDSRQEEPKKTLAAAGVFDEGFVPPAAAPLAKASGDKLGASFVAETLEAFRGFRVGPLIADWFANRFSAWKQSRQGADIQLKEAEEADEYLSAFWSPHTGELWSSGYARAVEALLPELETKSINVWNPGCGKGFEAWSFACVLKRRYPEARIKIWANDSDLLAISMAPNMVFSEDCPDYYADFMVQARNGLAFSQAIRDSIFFEFHDISNLSPLPPLDMILCRDTLPFLSLVDQDRLLGDFIEKLKPNGFVIMGRNERLGEGWVPAGSAEVPAYRKA